MVKQRLADFAELLQRSAVAQRAYRMSIWNASYRPSQAAAHLALSPPPVCAGLALAPLLGLTWSFPNQVTSYTRYPMWQFAPQILPYMPDLLALLSNLDPWSQHNFFVQENELLGCSPLHALQQGRYQQVFVAAQAANDDW